MRLRCVHLFNRRHVGSCNPHGRQRPEPAFLAEVDMTLAALMNLLWTQHVIWTRQVIVSTLANIPDAQTAVARLLQNQQDIGTALSRFYGVAFGQAMAQLLTDHIQISLKLVPAAAAGNTSEVAKQDAAWHDNATQMALVLSSANPNWTFSDMRAMLFDHLKRTTDEAMARIHKDWTADIVAFDGVLQQALQMADMFAAGLSAQFGTNSCNASCRCAG
jgi:hypothetical protein